MPGSDPAAMGRDLALQSCQGVHRPGGEGNFRSSDKMVKVLKRKTGVYGRYMRGRHVPLGSG